MEERQVREGNGRVECDADGARDVLATLLRAGRSRNGYVYAPNVNTVEEMTDMISASRSYQNNVEVMNTAKEMMLATLRLGQ